MSKPAKHFIFKYITFSLICLVLLFLTLSASTVYFFEKSYKAKIYPGITIDGVSFAGKTPDDVMEYFQKRNAPFQDVSITLTFEDKIATLSAQELAISYDGKWVGTQAYDIGRSGNFLSDTYQKSKSALYGTRLKSVFQMNNEVINQTIQTLASYIDYAPQDALFQFVDGKVKEFKPSKSGRQVDQDAAKTAIQTFISTISKNSAQQITNHILIVLPVKEVLPRITTENSNNFGLKELIGSGSSKFVGSIPGRVYNVALAADRMNGHLVPPGSEFSFNEALGDVSAATGYQQAYIIKDGRTVLGDGGGVCQVSTTLFRAIMNAGLPIIERHAHSYRVGYYEQDSGPGLDATVFSPSYDLKFRNDTSNYVLIQAKADKTNYSLVFDLYGTADGRKSEVSKPIIFSQTPPPPDLYQDDPNLPKGAVKQVDWKAWGAKVSFHYKVTKNDQILIDEIYASNYQPWQAVFLRGTSG